MTENNLIPEGYYRARAMSGELTESSKGNECAQVTFRLLDGDSEGRTITWWGYFTTEKNSERTLESLRYCGCKFGPSGDDITDLTGFDGQDVSLDIGHEEYEGNLKARVKWVNRDGGMAATPLDAAKKASFKDRMRARLLASKEEKPASGGADDLSDLPF